MAALVTDSPARGTGALSLFSRRGPFTQDQLGSLIRTVQEHGGWPRRPPSRYTGMVIRESMRLSRPA